MKLVVAVEGKTFNVEIENPNASPLIVNVDGTAFSVSADGAAEPAAALEQFANSSEASLSIGIFKTPADLFIIFMSSSMV